jgi:23S rRNA (guanine745-N1)-methyltransferase
LKTRQAFDVLHEKFTQLTCPLDGLQLQHDGGTLKCERGHSYDIARQGYVNLLPVQQKKSRDPGDSKEMVTARTHFLNAGYYAPVASRLAELSLEYTDITTSVSCLDAGCGDGYYLDYFYRYLEQQHDQAAYKLTGLDISKWAIISAAKRNPAITWVVGNNQHPPIGAQSVDILWSIFGFSHAAGFRKMLNNTGKLIRVDAGPDHLIELREIIYPVVRKGCESIDDVMQLDGFRQIDSQSLRYQTARIGRQPLSELLLMTPHLYRASHEGKQALSGIEQMALTIDVRYRVFESA